MNKKTLADQAYEIAARDLKACYKEKGILTGLHHFTDYWARDSLYAILGALCLVNPNNEHDVHLQHIKLNLKLLAENQDPKTGQIPFRVGSRLIFQKLFLKSEGHRQLHACFRQDKRFIHPFDESLRSTDPNPLFLIMATLYIKVTKDYQFLKQYFKVFQKAADWLATREGNSGLIFEGPYCTWEDTVDKKGEVLYTNVLYYAALKAYSQLYKAQGIKQEKIEKKAKKVKAQINRRFWTDNYFLDWRNEKVKREIFSTDGNLLAILFKVANETQADLILKHIKKHHLFEPYPAKTNDKPEVREKDVSLLNKILGMGSYHNRWLWPWLGSLGAVTQNLSGETSKAKTTLKRVAENFVRDDLCYEMYDENGAPIKFGLWFKDRGLGFKAEGPYAWTAGFYIFAYTQIFDPSNPLIKAFNKIYR